MLNDRVPVDSGCFKHDYLMDDIDDYRGNLIKLGFEINDRLDKKERKDLARLFMIHLILKDERNNTNHANDTDIRVSVDEVKTAINAYIHLWERVSDAVQNK